MQKNEKKCEKNLHISKKSSTFASSNKKKRFTMKKREFTTEIEKVFIIGQERYRGIILHNGEYFDNTPTYSSKAYAKKKLEELKDFYNI